MLRTVALTSHRDERLTEQTWRCLVLARRELLEQALHCLTKLRLGLVTAEIASTMSGTMKEVHVFRAEGKLHNRFILVEKWCDQLAHARNAWAVESRPAFDSVLDSMR